MKKDKIKILIEIPSKWFDTDLTGNLEWITTTVKNEVFKQIIKVTADKVQVFDIKIKEVDIRKAVIKELARRKADEIQYKS